MLRHGQEVNELVHSYPFRPDHELAGEFVRSNREPGDIVVAEDPLEQRWYAGPVDYWFRSFDDARRYLRIMPGGELRDIYVLSRILPEVSMLDSLALHAEGRVWLITSGETRSRRDRYLSQEQGRWLDRLEASGVPAVVGRDGWTRVYCLNCLPGALNRTDL